MILEHVNDQLTDYLAAWQFHAACSSSNNINHVLEIGVLKSTQWLLSISEIEMHEFYLFT
jgi:hypothetical protein